MPTYTFRCATCGDQDSRHPMREVPDEEECRGCGAPARRGVTTPYLALGDPRARRVLDETARTASEPAVVSALPTRRGPARPVSTNPLHARLPRP